MPGRFDQVRGRLDEEVRVEHEVQSFWLRRPGEGELRRTTVPARRPGQVLVRTTHSAISRGTETLVFRGLVPADQRLAVRAPFQEGDFPGPVKYGYLSVGVVDEGPEELEGCTVFCLHPHQTAYVVPAAAVARVPAGVPPRRALLAGVLETAVNALWDAGPLVGDRVTVVGTGVLGCCVGRLLARIPGVEVTLVDVDPDKAAVAAALGADFRTPGDAPREQDLVFHTSATSAGLQTALGCLVTDGTVVELSWYGSATTTVALGGSFHARRLTVRGSQVGTVAPARQGRRSPADRLALALDLLRDPAYDVLLTGESPFSELPTVMAALAAGRLPGLLHTLTYPVRPAEEVACSA